MTPVKISELTASGALTGTEVVAGVQSGSTVKILISAIMTYVRTVFAATPVTVAEGGTNATSAASARTSLGAAASGAVTASGLTQTTARLLGRTTADTGAIEEITVSAPLTFAAGALGSEVATQSDQETGTSVTAAVTPGRQQFHQSAFKGWVMFTNAAAIQASYNVSSITDNGAADWSVNWGTDFSSATYAVLAQPKYNFGGGTPVNDIVWTVMDTSFAAGVSRIKTERISDGATIEPTSMFVGAAGDQ